MNHLGGLVKGKAGHLLGEGRGQRGLFVVLRGGHGPARGDLFNAAAEGLGPHRGHPVKQLAAGLLRANVHRLHHQDVAGVQPFVQLHNGHAGGFVAVDDRPLDGRTAPVFGQQRNVQVDAALGGNRQHFRRQNAPIGHHHDQLRRKGADVLGGLAIPQSTGLIHRGAVGQRQLLDRRRGEHLLAAHGFVLSGEHAADLMPGGVQRLQTLGGNVRGSHEQNAHQFSSSSSSS